MCCFFTICVLIYFNLKVLIQTLSQGNLKIHKNKKIHANGRHIFRKSLGDNKNYPTDFITTVNVKNETKE